MLPTRGMTASRMVDLIAAETGKTYKRGRKAQVQALADITALIESDVPLEGVEIINR